MMVFSRDTPEKDTLCHTACCIFAEFGGIKVIIDFVILPGQAKLSLACCFIISSALCIGDICLGIQNAHLRSG